MTKQRISYIDAVKGLGIILVILGHTYQVPQLLHDIIYSFHMPLFFVISGYVYNEARYSGYSAKQYLKKRARDYLVPYYLFALINLGLVIAWRTLLTHEGISSAQILHYLLGILYCRSHMLYMPNCTPIWFLMSLFFASILFRMVMKHGRERAWIAALISLAVGYGLCLATDFPFPLKLDTVFMAVFFMYVGYRMKQWKGLEMPARTAAVGLIGAVLGAVNPVGMNENEYGNLLLFLPSSLLMIYALMLLFRKSDLGSAGILRLLGRHSILIVGFNYFLRDVAVEVYYMIPVVKRYPITWVSTFLITVLLAVLMVWVWEMLGQKREQWKTRHVTGLTDND